MKKGSHHKGMAINVWVEPSLGEKFKHHADQKMLKQNALLAIILKDFFSRMDNKNGISK